MKYHKMSLFCKKKKKKTAKDLSLGKVPWDCLDLLNMYGSCSLNFKAKVVTQELDGYRYQIPALSSLCLLGKHLNHSLDCS